ncbi:MAG TPA: hypothetical protein VFV93_09015 [Thermomicrobiales bacterium]|nr:hypothetical protein [Thermomicrobiales bacterium]
MRVVVALGFVGVLLLATWNLGRYPIISGWDEGIYLEFASNLANHGAYASNEAGTFNHLTPVGGTGPTIILPVAAAISIGDGDLAVARLPMALFLIFMVVSACLLARTIGATGAALAVIPLILTAGYKSIDTLWLGRQVLADVPALALMLFGLWCWIRSWSGGWRWLISASMFLGLSVVTKNQMILALGLALVVVAIVDRLYYRQLQWRHSIVPVISVGGCYLLWVIASLVIVGADGRDTYLENQRALSQAQFLNVSPSRISMNAKLLFADGQWLIALIAIGICLIASRQRTMDGLRRFVLPLITAISLVAFVGMSVPWGRLLYVPLALTAICVAVAVSDSLRWLDAVRGQNWVRNGVIGLVVVAALTGTRLLDDVRLIRTTDDRHAEEFAVLIDSTIPHDAIIHNWEWEIDFHSSHTFSHPDFRLFPALINEVYGGPSHPIVGEPRIPAVEYVIVGPFATQTAVFADALDERDATVRLQHGPYALYQLSR